MTPPEEPTPIIGLTSGGINPSTLGASSLGGSTLGINSMDYGGNIGGASGSSPNISSIGGNSNLQPMQQEQQQSQSVAQSPQHLQGTIV